MATLERTLGLLAMVVAMAGAPAWGEMVSLRVGTPPTGPPEKPAGPTKAMPPTAYVPQAKAAPALDGKLDDEAWKNARPVTLARTLDGSGPASQPTTVFLLRDAANLYVGFRCAEPQMEKVRGGQPGRDVDMWTSDSVELFLGVGGTYYHFGVNPAGGTYDGRGKESGWDLPLKTAVARGKDHWTATMALPLAKLAGKEPPPTEWTANFHRTRYASGAEEEFAWSPTFSGESHVPERFGRLILGEPPAQPVAAIPAAQGQPVEVVQMSSGVAVVRLDLSALPRGAKVQRADLYLFRGASGGAGDALAPVEVYPIAEGLKEGVEPRPTGKPLALRAPGFDRLDATDAVRACASRGETPLRADFLIKSAPPLCLANTCLEIVYAGKPGQVPPQVKGVKAMHRAGQTFITWDDPSDRFSEQSVTWGQLRDALRQPKVKYRIYRHSMPIHAANIQDAAFLGEVGPLSGFNVNSWSLERLINQTVFGHEDRGELAMYGPFNGWNMDSPQAGKLLIPRFALFTNKDGKALPPGTGLYVHSTAEPGEAYYAVTAVAEGVENLSELTAANSLTRPIAEAPAAWEPVEQPAGEGFGFDFRGRRHFYVT